MSSTRETTFVDTSGFYALLAGGDAGHANAVRLLDKAASARDRFVTTDYVLDETATLLKTRGGGRVLPEFFRIVLESAVCRVEWIDEERFLTARDFFVKHMDHDYSFTDCVSFCIMRELKVRRALTSDAHFREAGFETLL